LTNELRAASASASEREPERSVRRLAWPVEASAELEYEAAMRSFDSIRPELRSWRSRLALLATAALAAGFGCGGDDHGSSDPNGVADAGDSAAGDAAAGDAANGDGGKAGAPGADDAAAPGSIAAWNAAATYRGMNLGQSLDAWVFDADQVITKSLIDTLVSTGTTTLRLPVKSHMNGTAPTADATLSEQVKARVLEVLDWCEAANPRPQVLFDPLHHYKHYIGDPSFVHPEEDLVNPADTDLRAINIWKQWSQLTAGYGDWLAFDLVNEPLAWDAARTNAKYAELLAAIRQYTNRPVFVEPSGQASVLRVWEIEGAYLDDPNLGISVHLYGPGSYTHGATGSAYGPHMRAVIAAEQDMALWWAQAHDNRPINVGELGSRSTTGNTGRDLYQAAHRAEAESRIAAGANISGHAWMYGSDFALLDNNGGAWTWKPGMQAAVVGDLASVALDPVPADLFVAKTATVAHVAASAAGYTIDDDGTINLPASAANADFSSRGFVILRRQLPLVAGATYQIVLAAARGADAIVTLGGNYVALSADDWWLSYAHSYAAAGHPHDQSTTDRIHGDKHAAAYRLTVPAIAGSAPWIEAVIRGAAAGAGKARLHVCRVE
jgi:hypothetical protein